MLSGAALQNFYLFGYPGILVFSKLQAKGFSIIFYNFRCNLTFYESENFSDSFLHRS